jgi:hypothetical protein
VHSREGDAAASAVPPVGGLRLGHIRCGGQLVDLDLGVVRIPPVGGLFGRGRGKGQQRSEFTQKPRQLVTS